MASTQVITVKAGQDLTAFVRDVYAIPRTAAARVTEEAIRAIVEANPHIARVKVVAEGTPLVVPELPDLVPGSPAGTTPPAPLSDLTQQAGDALRSVRSALAESRDGTIREAKDTLQLLRSREFKAAAANDPLMQDRIAAITAAANAASNEAEAKSKAQNAGLDELATALQEFVSVTGQL
jgi:hypothetical protein